MNPLTKVKLINELNQREAELGVQDKVSWHAEYKDSAWIFLGGLSYELTEGDIICVFSQYGEIVNINLVRDQKTGKSKGFCFICYEDQRSTILAVDNFNGIKIKGRTIRVDHVANYRPPKDTDDIDDVTKTLREQGCGLKTPPPSSSESPSEDEAPAKKHKDKKEKRKKKKEKKKLKREKTALDGKQTLLRERISPPEAKIKKEKEDPGYSKYAVACQESLPHREEAKGSKDVKKLSGEAQEFRGTFRGNEISHDRDFSREYPKDDRLKDQRGDKNRYDYRTEKNEMNADTHRRDERQSERERRDDRQDDRSRREDRQDDKGSRPGMSKDSYRESSKRYESHYESHTNRRDGHGSYSESSAYSNQHRERSENRGWDRHSSSKGH